MSSTIISKNFRQACARCRNQKRKCDKAAPKCSLCMRLGRTCIYPISPPSSSFSNSPENINSINTPVDPLSEPYIRNAIHEKLSGKTPEEVATEFYRSVNTWFPFICDEDFCQRLPVSWDEAPTDLSLLFLSMMLITSNPEGQEGHKYHIPPNLNSLYLSLRSWIAVLEGLGFSSLDFLHARVLVALFELSHGIPSAYVSIGTLRRAAEGRSRYSTGFEKAPNENLVWQAIMIMDRYITFSEGHSLLKNNHTISTRIPIAAPLPNAITSTPHNFSRLFEASALLETTQEFLDDQKSKTMVDAPEIVNRFNYLISFEYKLQQEVPEGLKIYSGSWAMFSSAIMLFLNTIAKSDLQGADEASCTALSRAHLDSIIKDIFTKTQPLVNGDSEIDFHLLPPFITHLVSQAAKVLTIRLQVHARENDERASEISMLKALRSFLGLVGRRWGAAGRALSILDEDTTPRTMKAMGWHEQIQVAGKLQ